LRYTANKKAGGDTTVSTGVITVGVAFAFFPAAPLVLLRRGKEATVEKGTIFEVFTDQAHTLSIKPDEKNSRIDWDVTSATQPIIRSDMELTLAVMDLDALSVERDVGTSVADMIRTHIGKHPGITMIERTRMQQVLKEQNIQNSDRTDSLTAVILGRYLNVKKMLFGSVSALENHYTIHVELVDVETGAIDGIREVQCQACSLKDLPPGVARLGAVVVEGLAE